MKPSMAPAPPPTAILRLSRAGEQGAGSHPPGAERWECCQGPLGVSAQRQRAWSSRMLSLKEKDGLCVCVCVCVFKQAYFILFYLFLAVLYLCCCAGFFLQLPCAGLSLQWPLLLRSTLGLPGYRAQAKQTWFTGLTAPQHVGS